MRENPDNTCNTYYHYSMKDKDLLKLFLQNGWKIERINGSHHILRKNGRTTGSTYPKAWVGNRELTPSPCSRESMDQNGDRGAAMPGGDLIRAEGTHPDL